MTFALMLLGFVLGCFFTLWLVSEFVKDAVFKKELYFKDAHGNWIPKDPTK